MSEFNEKVVIVTGSGKGIGKGIAKHFASKGAYVVVATIDADNGRETEKEIIDSGGEAFFIETDVADDSSIQNMVRNTIKRYGKIDTLVNNAGITVFKPMIEATVEDWDKVLNIDLRGTFLCSKYVAKEMIKQESGSIINISSNHSKATLPDTEMYAAAKGGVNAMTMSMAQSLGKYNIRVNAICPGFTDTPHHRKWLEAKANPAQVDKDVLSLHATKRIGLPEDVAKLALYLASDDSVMMTGQSLTIDGGVSTRLYHSEEF